MVCLTGQQDGMAQVVIEHVRADPKVFGRFCGTEQRRHRSKKIGEMIGDGQNTEAELFDLSGLFHPFGPRFCARDVYAESKWFHF